MKILSKIYIQLLACPVVPPECGGIIGCNNGEIITHVIFDRYNLNDAGVMYTPNIQFLNQKIEEWAECGIEFRGIFHTHAPQWGRLSNNDRVYIVDILNAMPSDVDFLYFPLVFPGKQIKNHIVRRNGSAVDIVDDDIEIVQEEDIKNERNK